MKKFWLAVGLIAFVSVLIVIALVENPLGPREPEYHGKRLTRWIDDLATDKSSMAQTNATLAIRQMGTNAVPFLVQMLHAKDSYFERESVNLLRRQYWVDLHARYDFQKRLEALEALVILGPDAKAAVPDLANLLKSGQPTYGSLATLALSRIGQPAVPALETALTDTNRWTRMMAAQALGNVGESSSVPNLLGALKDRDPVIRSTAAEAMRGFPDQANVIVPALVNCLDDRFVLVREYAARTLGSFGPNARPAFPKLLQMVGGTNEVVVSRAATEALKEIDPDAAAKLDGK